MLFKPGTPLYSYEVAREASDQVLFVNYIGAPFVPTLVTNPEVFLRTIDLLNEVPNVSRIVFVQQRNYAHGPHATLLLQEIANLYLHLTKQENILSPSKLSIMNSEYLRQRHYDVSYLLQLLKQDPIACFVELGHIIHEEKTQLSYTPTTLQTDQMSYVRLLERFFSLVKRLSIVRESEPYMKGYTLKSREIYAHFLSPDIVPNFAFTRLVSQLPDDAEIIRQYSIGPKNDMSTVTILKRVQDSKYLYHLMPPEYSLEEDKQKLLNLARNVLIEHQPKAEEFTDPEKTRQVFFNVSRDLLRELGESKRIRLPYDELQLLATILVRHTIGFGLLEVLLQDTHIQDIVLNAPISFSPVFLRHGEFDECITNVIPAKEDADSWAAKFRMISGRPLDEANPILDTDLHLGTIHARIAVIQQPLSPRGLSYAVRRHREDPWTLPLFIKNNMINNLASGLMSFLIDGSRTILVAGTRSSGKTSLLGSLMLEILPKYRIIVLEDTLELPVEAIRKLQYDILRMKVRSGLMKTSTEVAADEGIRASLRLGDSSLIVGEVRSLEAQALYEAMRVGALANVVAGTIHGASPYGVFDRVVNDLKVPITSFKATDCIIVANPVKTSDGLHSMRRVVQVAEVRKHWTRDPEEEGGFVDLLKYNVEKDTLEPTEDLINGDSEIVKNIAAGVRGWAGDWDAVYDNILLRAKIKQEIVDIAEKTQLPSILEAAFNGLSNTMFHQFSKDVTEEVGLPISERVFPLWQSWLKKQVRGKKV